MKSSPTESSTVDQSQLQVLQANGKGKGRKGREESISKQRIIISISGPNVTAASKLIVMAVKKKGIHRLAAKEEADDISLNRPMKLVPVIFWTVNLHQAVVYVSFPATRFNT